MSYDDDKKLVVGFGAGLLRLWVVVLLIAAAAAIIAVAPWVAALIVIGVAILIYSTVQKAKKKRDLETNAAAAEKANLEALAAGQICQFIRANGKWCIHGATVGNFCTRHASTS